MRRKPGQLLDLEAQILAVAVDVLVDGDPPEVHGFALAKRLADREAPRSSPPRDALQGPRPDSRTPACCRSRWEDHEVAEEAGRPRRRLYRVTSAGQAALAVHLSSRPRSPTAARPSARASSRHDAPGATASPALDGDSTRGACPARRPSGAARRWPPISSNTPRWPGRRRPTRSTSSVGCCGASPPTCPGGGPPERRVVRRLVTGEIHDHPQGDDTSCSSSTPSSTSGPASASSATAGWRVPAAYALHARLAALIALGLRCAGRGALAGRPSCSSSGRRSRSSPSSGWRSSSSPIWLLVSRAGDRLRARPPHARPGRHLIPQHLGARPSTLPGSAAGRPFLCRRRKGLVRVDRCPSTRSWPSACGASPRSPPSVGCRCGRRWCRSRNSTWPGPTTLRALRGGAPWTGTGGSSWSTAPNRPPKAGAGPLRRPAWRTVAVPGCWTRQDVGDPPAYTNVQMPFPGEAPEVPVDNPTGLYRTEFAVPADWRGRRIVLQLGGAESVACVWCNGTFVGMSKDSRLAAEFDLTPHLVRAGQHARRHGRALVRRHLDRGPGPLVPRRPPPLGDPVLHRGHPPGRRGGDRGPAEDRTTGTLERGRPSRRAARARGLDRRGAWWRPRPTSRWPTR